MKPLKNRGRSLEMRRKKNQAVYVLVEILEKYRRSISSYLCLRTELNSSSTFVLLGIQLLWSLWWAGKVYFNKRSGIRRQVNYGMFYYKVLDINKPANWKHVIFQKLQRSYLSGSRCAWLHGIIRPWRNPAMFQTLVASLNILVEGFIIRLRLD